MPTTFDERIGMNDGPALDMGDEKEIAEVIDALPANGPHDHLQVEIGGIREDMADLSIALSR